MFPIRQYVNRLIFPLLPETRCFALKRLLLRLSGAKVGKNVRVCSSAMIIGSGALEIGDNTWIGHRVLISSSSSIYIGHNVDVAPNVYIGTGTHTIDIEGERIAGEGISKDIVVNDGAWLCTGCMILPGVTIGEKCVVAAGAVVTHSSEAKKLLAGVPAVVKRGI